MHFFINSQRDIGINKEINAFRIWKPIAPNEYKALGYVIDTRYINISGLTNFRLPKELNKFNELDDLDELDHLNHLNNIYEKKVTKLNSLTQLNTLTKLNNDQTKELKELKECNDYIKIHNMFYKDFMNNPLQPSKDLIYCVSKTECLSKTENTNTKIWETPNYINGDDFTPLKDKFPLYQTIDNLVTLEPRTKLLDLDNCGCDGRSATVFKNNEPTLHDKNGGIKDKKYSILEIYN